MTAAALKLPPPDPNVAPALADADVKRRIAYLRMLIARGNLSLPRRRLALSELRELEPAK